MSSTESNVSCESYTGLRSDIISLIPSEVGTVLDIGCSIGELGKKLKAEREVEVVGVELNENMAAIAAEKLDRVIAGDIEALDLGDYFRPGYFDCIVFGDILEHLRDPWGVLRRSVESLADDGIVVASIPNIRHYTTVLDLAFRGCWPYRGRGIHDRTHLRFFTFRSIMEMFQRAGLQITTVERRYRIIESPHSCNRFSRYLACPPLRELLTFQYLVVAKRSHENLDPHP